MVSLAENRPGGETSSGNILKGYFRGLGYGPLYQFLVLDWVSGRYVVLQCAQVFSNGLFSWLHTIPDNMLGPREHKLVYLPILYIHFTNEIDSLSRKGYLPLPTLYFV